jgi:hypothetical protein
VDALELLGGASCTSSSIGVSWRPPTKNKERISSYKLMLTTRTGARARMFSVWRARTAVAAWCVPCTLPHMRLTAPLLTAHLLRCRCGA